MTRRPEARNSARSDWLKEFLQLFVILQILGRDTGNLHVEELSSVEHGLLFLSLHAVE